MSKTNTIYNDLKNAVGVLQFVGCQFEFCEGPTKLPTDMMTCRVCYLLHNLEKRYPEFKPE